MNLRPYTSLLALLIAAATSVSAQNDDLPYDSGSDGSDGALTFRNSLPGRYAFAYAYDGVNQRTVVFGGRTSSGATTINETLLFDGETWTRAQPATFVSARYEPRMAFDAARGNIVMFGGLRADGVMLADTWIWNGANWTQANPANSPSARHFAEMVYDPVGQRVILFGGLNSANQHLTDMWAWNGVNWTQLAPSNAPETSYNYTTYHQLVYETHTGRLILYNEVYQKTYAFNTGTLAWSVISTPLKPNTGNYSRMVYDTANQEIVLAGGSSNNQTWVFKNDEWNQRSPATPVPFAYDGGLVYDAARQRVFKFYGNNNSTISQETYAWDGANWTFIVGRNFVFDMTSRPDGVYNFTTISVPADIDVYFKKNAGNTPVVWLASGNVEIQGRLYLNGQDAPDNDQSGRFADSGPGGFAGGVGGVRFDVSGSYLGTSGQGPGGGVAPTAANTGGAGGTFNGTYGNRLLQPLIGGSGGSGATSGDTGSGGNGGGGGGAILIASSRDVTVNGGIFANGGLGRALAPQSNSRYGGGGSGGGIRIVADRILGTGTIQANGGDSYAGGAGFDGGAGRIRLEAFYRPIAPNASPVPSATAPTETDSLVVDRKLWVANVAGEAVGPSPTGSLLTPDVVFQQPGQITVTVQSQNIPAGTPVKLRISTETGMINLPAQGSPAVTLDGSGSASFTTTVPAGLGTIQATAEFTIQ